MITFCWSIDNTGVQFVYPLSLYRYLTARPSLFNSMFPLLISPSSIILSAAWECHTIPLDTFHCRYAYRIWMLLYRLRVQTTCVFAVISISNCSQWFSFIPHQYHFFHNFPKKNSLNYCSLVCTSFCSNNITQKNPRKNNQFNRKIKNKKLSNQIGNVISVSTFLGTKINLEHRVV